MPASVACINAASWPSSISAFIEPKGRRLRAEPVQLVVAFRKNELHVLSRGDLLNLQRILGPTTMRVATTIRTRWAGIEYRNWSEQSDGRRRSCCAAADGTIGEKKNIGH